MKYTLMMYFNATVEAKKRIVRASAGGSKPVGVALYSYKAKADFPGGFKELDLIQGEQRQKKSWLLDVFGWTHWQVLSGIPDTMCS